MHRNWNQLTVSPSEISTRDVGGVPQVIDCALKYHIRSSQRAVRFEDMVATYARGPSRLLLFSLDSVSPQLKGGYAGLTVIERFDRTLRSSIKSPNFQFNPAVPR